MAETLLAALVSLDGPGHYFHWHWINISYANLTVIALMVGTFVAALLVPFPGRRHKKETK
ncbi:MAG TPA: hypothetical protein VFN59_02090 [Acidimicrobiales bacterium]|nr:hypothetical protein [Acidimicrobiales bacterium]